MEFVLTANEMKLSDSTAIDEYGIGSLVLMERAAYETARIIMDKYGKDIYVGVIAGSGNNGGDGIAIARILNENGIRTDINMVGDVSKLTRETTAQLETAKKLDIPIYYGVEHTLYDVIVDAMFGIGITRQIEGRYKEAVEAVNSSKAKVVSVDIPSGINTDDGSIMGCAIKADITVTFQYRKLGHMLYPGALNVGELYCVPIGIPPAVNGNKRNGVITFTDPEHDLKLPARSPYGNKGTFGKVLLVAGSRNMGGACYLSALSSYRIGAGMVRIFTASENREPLLKKLPEAIVDTYNDDGTGQLLEEEREALKAGIRWADVVAIGPGLSTSLTALEIFRTVLEICEIPMVIDADALNLLAQNESLLKQFEFGRRKNEANVIFTPHLGELSRLMKTSVDSIKADFISCCRSFVKTYDVTLVCKDARTLVSKRKKLTYLNSSGNEGMATAGSGDVLTGITAGLMAQGLNGFEAAIMGVYAHGLAGDYARDKTSSYYVMAQDIIQSLKELRQ
jgi:NAD(P)H-hydrate epimerase